MPANTTYTYTANMAETSRAVHAGINALTFSVLRSAAFGTVSDVILLGKIPNGATIVDAWAEIITKSTAQKWQFSCVNPGDFTKSGGTLLMGDTAGTMTAVSTIARFTLNAPLRVSLSADTVYAYTVLYANCLAGTETTSLSMQGCIMYVCDGREASD